MILNKLRQAHLAIDQRWLPTVPHTNKQRYTRRLTFVWKKYWKASAMRYFRRNFKQIRTEQHYLHTNSPASAAQWRSLQLQAQLLATRRHTLSSLPFVQWTFNRSQFDLVWCDILSNAVSDEIRRQDEPRHVPFSCYSPIRLQIKCVAVVDRCELILLTFRPSFEAVLHLEALPEREWVSRALCQKWQTKTDDHEPNRKIRF